MTQLQDELQQHAGPLLKQPELNMGFDGQVLTDWNVFLTVMQDVTGVEVVFSVDDENKTVVNKSINGGGTRKTVKQFHEDWVRYFMEECQGKVELVNQVPYLTDIPLRSQFVESVTRNYPYLKYAINPLLNQTPWDLNCCLQIIDKDMPVPRMDATGYLAPPFFVGSPAHADGMGCLLSWNIMGFGPNNSYNVVGQWPELTEVQSLCLRKMYPGFPPADLDLTAPLNLTPDVFAYSKQDEFIVGSQRKTMENLGLLPRIVRQCQGDLVILSPYRFHIFKKAMTDIGENYDVKFLPFVFNFGGNLHYLPYDVEMMKKAVSNYAVAELARPQIGSFGFSQLNLIVCCLRSLKASPELWKGVPYGVKLLAKAMAAQIDNMDLEEQEMLALFTHDGNVKLLDDKDSVGSFICCDCCRTLGCCILAYKPDDDERTWAAMSGAPLPFLESDIDSKYMEKCTPFPQPNKRRRGAASKNDRKIQVGHYLCSQCFKRRQYQDTQYWGLLLRYPTIFNKD